MLILCKKCAEMCSNILFQRIQHLCIDFQHKPYIISADSADFLQNYRLTAADPSNQPGLNYVLNRRLALAEGPFF